MTTPAVAQRLRVLVAEEVRSLMARRRISGVKLAEEIGRTQQYVSRRLSGDVAFDVDDLQQIAAVLGVTVADLLPRGGGPLVTAYSLTTPAAPHVVPNLGSPRTPGTRSRFRERVAA